MQLHSARMAYPLNMFILIGRCTHFLPYILKGSEGEDGEGEGEEEEEEE
jgi:hypothetical protein